MTDPDITAIALHVDSPGGTVAGCADLAGDDYQDDEVIVATQQSAADPRAATALHLRRRKCIQSGIETRMI